MTLNVFRRSHLQELWIETKIISSKLPKNYLHIKIPISKPLINKVLNKLLDLKYRGE